jgi:mono/diheme cytochrome c family protein
MSTAKRFALAIPLALAAGIAFAADGPGLGKPISEADLAKWDISVPPDGKGLPSGSGTPAQGAAMYVQKCEVCHGKDGVGGTNAALPIHPASRTGPWRSMSRTPRRSLRPRSDVCVSAYDAPPRA